MPPPGNNRVNIKKDQFVCFSKEDGVKAIDKCFCSENVPKSPTSAAGGPGLVEKTPRYSIDTWSGGEGALLDNIYLSSLTKAFV